MSEQDAKKEQAPPAQQAAPEEKKEPAKKKKKINQLSLQELEKKIKEVEQKMGSLRSSFAQQLLRRKEQLLNEAQTYQANEMSEDKSDG
ncbi:MAG: hypothetical protein JW714_00825 [Candidatus Omnitrophica bacterium]|nr:hypothetical protein [Candidatus Omnitrophota bacterium]